MRKTIPPRLPRWPFFLGDALLLAVAGFICAQGKLPLGTWELFALVLSVALGAGICAWPFLIEYRAAARLAEADSLTTVISQIKKLEQLAAQIGYATSQSQVVRQA